MHVRLDSAIEFDQAHDGLIAQFRFLQCQHSNPWVANLQQREVASERARMFRSLKCNQWIVEALRLPVGLRFAPASRMSCDPVDELVMTNILRPLICISAASSGRSDQRQSNCMVVWFV